MISQLLMSCVLWEVGGQNPKKAIVMRKKLTNLAISEKGLANNEKDRYLMLPTLIILTVPVSTYRWRTGGDEMYLFISSRESRTFPVRGREAGHLNRFIHLFSLFVLCYSYRSSGQTYFVYNFGLCRM